MYFGGICRLAKDSEAMIDQMIAGDHDLFKKELGPLPEHIVSQLRGGDKRVFRFIDLIFYQFQYFYKNNLTYKFLVIIKRPHF